MWLRRMSPPPCRDLVCLVGMAQRAWWKCVATVAAVVAAVAVAAMEDVLHQSARADVLHGQSVRLGGRPARANAVVHHGHDAGRDYDTAVWLDYVLNGCVDGQNFSQTYSATWSFLSSSFSTDASLIHMWYGGIQPPASSSASTWVGERISGTMWAIACSPLSLRSRW